MSEEQDKLKTAVPVLDCGHEASWEHEFVEGLGQVINMCMATNQPIIDPCMQYVRDVFAYFYMPIPSYDEMQKIILSHKLNNHSQEVN